MRGHYTLVIGILIYSLHVSSGQLGRRTACGHCEDARTWDDCFEEICGPDENCYINITQTANGKRVNARCISQDASLCTSAQHGFLLGSRASTGNGTLCETCCHGDNCNVDFCKHIALKPITSHTGVKECHQCKLRGWIWQCSYTQTCTPGQVCFAQQLITTGLGNLPYYHGGCTDESRCDLVNIESFSNEHRFGEVGEGTCCYETNCNNASIFAHTASKTTDGAPTLSPTITTTVKSTTYWSTAKTPLQCMQCVNEGVGWNCDHVQQCSADELCFVQELDLTVNIPSIPNKYFHGGCSTKQRCGTIGSISVQDESGLAIVANGDCCSTDNCNKQIMEYYKHPTTQSTTTTPKPTTEAPLGVTRCMHCINEGVGWNCNNTQQCATDEVCFVQELKFAVPIPGIEKTYYHGGCINKVACNKVSHTSLYDEHGLAGVIRGECCYNNECNKQTLDVYKGLQTPERVQLTTPGGITTVAPLKCMQCVNEGVGWNCDHVQQCSAEELCFVQELDLTVNIPSIPNKYFHGGCSSKQRCSTIGSISVQDESGLAIVANGECCSTDNCNKQIMENYKHTTAVPTASMEAPAVSQCMQCLNEGVGWNCGHTQSCLADEVCFIQELDLSLNIPSVPSKYYHGGCIGKTACSSISSVSVSDEHGLATVERGQCCHSDNCNQQLWTQFQSRK